MISPVSSLASPQATGQAPPTPNPPAAPKKSAPPQDTVHLSQAALAATGDKDHDGDSH